MPNKTYGQLCPMARALDVLGDRWTLLVVRELLLGPKRYKDLLATLPAMGTNRLSERLAMLVENGVIAATTLALPPGAPAYELTEFGEQLRQPMIALGLWGLQLPEDDRLDPSSARAELVALCLSGASNPAASAGMHETYEFHVGPEVFHVAVNDGEVRARSGASVEPANVEAHCDIATFTSLALRELTPEGAVSDGRVTLERGGQRAFTRAFKVLDYRR